MNEGMLHSMARQTNMEQYNKLQLVFNYYKADTLPNNIKITKMERDYLVDLKNVNLDFPDCVISEQLDKFQNKNIKSFNIKSPYDTGKTQLIKRYLNKFENKRVLWISYRKTLTADILHNFEEMGFKDYQSGDYECDRLIIQLESLNKTKSEWIDENEEVNIVKYDLVIN